jgi:hypothetical protein
MTARHLHLIGATGALRMDTFQGRSHLVVPVTALMEGVIWPANAETPEYVPASELSALGWDGRPVMHGHPIERGALVPADAPTTLDGGALGAVFNAAVRNGHLEMEAWIDPVRASRVSGADRTLARLSAGETVEVSVGVFVEPESRSGEHGGKRYASVWRGIVPDHLAFLPEGQVGACSVAMGCGAQRHLVTARGFELNERYTSACACSSEKGNTMQMTKTADEWKAYWDAMPASLKNYLDEVLARPVRTTTANGNFRDASDTGAEHAAPPPDLNAAIRVARDLPADPTIDLPQLPVGNWVGRDAPDVYASIRVVRGLPPTTPVEAARLAMLESYRKPIPQSPARATSAHEDGVPPPPDMNASIRAAYAPAVAERERSIREATQKAPTR